MVGTGKGAENGVLIKSGTALEVTHKIQTIVFDKTGTITEGKPKVTDVLVREGLDPNELLLLAASAEKGSEHPLGEAIVRDAEEKQLSFLKPSAFNALPGFGIAVTIDGKVTEGLTSVDESMLTGESMNVEKKAGDAIIGGSTNKNGTN